MAVLLWSLLASLTALTPAIPPFQLTAMSFAIAGGLGILFMLLSGRRIGDLARVPRGAWLLGVAGLFGYHALYFIALRRAPALEASLLNYLWPLLIVLLSRETLLICCVTTESMFGLLKTTSLQLASGNAASWRGSKRAIGFLSP